MNASNQPEKIEMETRILHKQCLSCLIHTEEVATIGGLIAASDFFEVRQDYSVPIPGFIILTSKRHVKSIMDFTQEERIDFINFMCRVRTHMRACLDIYEVTMVQEENSSHFHLWLFPWYAWMERFGNDVASLRSIMQYARERFAGQSHVDAVYQATEKLTCCINRNFKR